MMKKIFFAAILSTMLITPAFSYTRYEVPAQNSRYIFDIYDQGETVNFLDESFTSTYNLTNNQMNALFDAAKKWTEYINFDPNDLPIYKIYTSNELNASALSPYSRVIGEPYKYTLIDSMMTNKKIIPIEDYSMPDGDGLIEVGVGLIEEYPMWSNYDGPTAVFKDPLPDIYTTMIHEMYHSIGLSSGAMQYKIKDGDKRFYFGKDATSPLAIWDSYLKIYTGAVSPSATYNPQLEIAAQGGVPIKINSLGDGEFDISTYSPYFTGPETMKVLTGLENKTVAEMEAYLMSKGGLKNYSSYYDDTEQYPSVLGLPVNVIEQGRPELSHIELQNSFMSHQGYQNWVILMEAELAVLKDLGYDVDLRKYFGQSYYLDNVTADFTRGYGNIWNGTTYTGRSTTESGIGLHIYGDNNIITQASNILSDGNYTIGTRIDGVNNNYTLNSGYKVDTAGKGSIGIAAMWGKNHTINLNSGSSVTATGEGGIAASFDFGKNVMGGYNDDRGSYSSYEMSEDKNVKAETALQGALVENFDIAGTLEGKKASIYISENAHVKNINIIKGSTITGDIISQWNSVKSGTNMYVQDSNGNPVTGQDLSKIYFTNLNFVGDGTNPYNGSFSDNISGANDIFNTIKMNIQENGTLDFGNTSKKTINVYNITNEGTINLVGDTSITTQDNAVSIGGSGTINVADNKSLETFNVLNIANILNLGKGELDTSNQVKENITIHKLVTSDGSKLDIDLGDTFNIAYHDNIGTTEISRIYADEEEVTKMEEQGTSYAKPIFTNKTVDLGTSETNVYYGGNKYTLSQDTTDKYLVVKSVSDSNGVGDAAQDPKTVNYIVKEDEVQGADGGTVSGKVFEVSGADLDFDGNKGLIVDGTMNPQGTTIKTSTSGAAEEGAYKGTYTVQNGGLLNIVATEDNPEVTVESDNNAIYVGQNSNVQLLSGKGSEIEIAGNIVGESFENSKVMALGDNISLNNVDKVYLYSHVNNLELNNQVSNTKINAVSGNINVNQDSLLAGGTNAILLNGADINLQNGEATPIDLAGLYLNNNTNLAIDVDIQNDKADTFVFDDEADAVVNYGTINIGNVNMLNINERTILEEEEYAIPIVSPEYKNTALNRSITFNGLNPQTIVTPIYKYNTVFGALDDGSVAFGISKAGGGYNGFNPAVVVAPVAAQLGGYLSQLNSYDEAFRNLDMKMLMTREERQAYKMANSYASEVQPKVFSPTYLPEKDSAGWFRPYASFEKVNLKGGPNVENVMYGSYFGGDSQMKELRNGWDFQYSVYVGYNGSHQNYQGNSIYQNGGNLGATGIWYKDDFFTALTANVGASVADASTMYGSEDFPMLMTGVASKTGYNWELAKGKFIIQPSWLMSYTFVNTFDYTNAAGVRIKSDPLHAINMAPGIKFIGNLKHGWQPYVGVQMVWNIMDKTDFHANNVSLPELSVKPYVQYGVGVQKRWGERFTGFFQTMFRNGGRNGVALSLGFRWAIGKDSNSNPNYKSKNKTSNVIIKKTTKNIVKKPTKFGKFIANMNGDPTYVVTINK